ncbi:MAG: hypothetical protein ACOX6J_02665 [Oscillospiraceae bacterium]|jgi:hypothetical protein
MEKSSWKKIISILVTIGAVLAVIAGVMAILGLLPHKYSKEVTFDLDD